MIERGLHSWMIMIIHGQYYCIRHKTRKWWNRWNIVWSWILNSWRRAYTGSFCYGFRTFRELFFQRTNLNSSPNSKRTLALCTYWRTLCDCSVTCVRCSDFRKLSWDQAVMRRWLDWAMRFRIKWKILSLNNHK